jgi:DNA-binding phage protein
VIPASDLRIGVVREIGLAIEREGWSATSKRSGVDRTELHRAFGRHGRGHPTLRTIERVIPHVGLELTAREVAR